MRIADSNDPDKVPALPAADSSAQAARHGQEAPGAMSISEDRTELSSVAGKLSEMLQTDPARAERIRELKAQVANGTYEVDAQGVSRAIVDHALGQS